MSRAQTDEYLQQSPGLAFLLSKAQGLVRGQLGRAVASHEVHVGQVQIFLALIDGSKNRLSTASTGTDAPPLTQTRLARLTGIEKSSLVMFLDDMQQRGWVERRPHPRDRRAHIIAVTSAGLRRCTSIRKSLASFESQAMAFLTPSQKAAFISVLVELIERLEGWPGV